MPASTHVCRVSKTGSAEDGPIYVWLRENNSRFNHWFKANESTKRELLAVALTAVTTGLEVEAMVSDTSEYSTLLRLYVRR